jgi:hypothetical protein
MIYTSYQVCEYLKIAIKEFRYKYLNKENLI